MDKVKRTIPELKKLLDSAPRALIARVADEAGTKVIYLRQLSRGDRQSGGVLARRIDAATHELCPDFHVSKGVLRPDLYGEVVQ